MTDPENDPDDFLYCGDDETAEAVSVPAAAPAPVKDPAIGQRIKVDHVEALRMIAELEKRGHHHSSFPEYDDETGEKIGQGQTFDLGRSLLLALDHSDDESRKFNKIDFMYPDEDEIDEDVLAEWQAKWPAVYGGKTPWPLDATVNPDTGVMVGTFPDGTEFYEYWVITHRRDKYTKQMASMAAGKYYPERMNSSGNRVGKTLSAAYEVTCHLTGEYPDWWEGRVIKPRKSRGGILEPVELLAVGVSTYLLKDVVQKELLGPSGDPSLWGTGMIRGSLIRGTSRMPNVTGGVEKIRVQHISGTISELILRPSEAGADRFAGTNYSGAWMDEKVLPAVYNEIQARVSDRGGFTLLTYTPVDGTNEIVSRFLPEAHITAADKQQYNVT